MLVLVGAGEAADQPGWNLLPVPATPGAGKDEARLVVTLPPEGGDLGESEAQALLQAGVRVEDANVLGAFAAGGLEEEGLDKVGVAAGGGRSLPGTNTSHSTPRRVGSHSAAVHLASLRLRDFRNYARADLAIGPGFHLLLGPNAQGKTNLLEAVYLLATLRSFRGVGGAQLVRRESRGYFVGATAVGQGTHELKAYWSPRERRLSVDGHPVRRLADFLGYFRAVIFCTEDLQLVKGAARGRRRFLDLLLSQTQPGYLELLLRYTQVLRHRNALLKHPGGDPAALDSFTAQLVDLGGRLMQARRELLPRLLPLARLAHRRISQDAEELHLEYAPAVRGDFAVELARARPREIALRMTLLGPHRDDLQLLLDGQPAAQFGSEGQKRSLVLALKMAQAEYLAAVHGSMPVLLLDDVMGELDVRRRSGLLPLLQHSHRQGGQVLMTCTEENWPRDLGLDLVRWQVENGTVTRRDGPPSP